MISKPKREPVLSSGTVLVRVHERVTFAYRGREVMLLSVSQGRYYNLNRVGTRIWEMLETPTRFADLCARLQAEFEVDPAQCHADVLACVAHLIAERLVRITEP